MKQCSKCKKEKPESEFYLDKAMKLGLHSWCIACVKKLALKGGRRLSKLQKKDLRLKSTHGISLRQYQEMLESQNGVCAICGNNETVKQQGIPQPLSVDHCHETGKVRGLLCSRCNAAIGLLREDLDILASAASYLINADI